MPRRITENRTTNITSVRLDPESRAFLDEFCFHNDVSQSEAMRILIDRARGLSLTESGYRQGRKIGYATVHDAITEALDRIPRDLPTAEERRAKRQIPNKYK